MSQMKRAQQAIDALRLGSVLTEGQLQDLLTGWRLLNDDKKMAKDTNERLMETLQERQQELLKLRPLAESYAAMIRAAEPYIARYQAVANRAGIEQGEQMFGAKFISYIESLEDALSKVGCDEQMH